MDLAEFRTVFPITAERAYLFSGGLAPGSTPVRAAIDTWLERWTDDPLYHRARYFEDWDAVRSGLGRLFRCPAESIALTDSTSRASNLAMALIEAPPGSNVVVDATTYPSSLYPWLLPGRRNVEVRTVPGAQPSTDDIARLVDDRTVAVSVSHVAALTGVRHDLASLADVSHDHGALLVVDVAQSAGAIDIDLPTTGVDLAAGVAMKWLLGTPGTGFLYIAPHLQERIPSQAGYVGAEVATNADVGKGGTASTLRFRTGAQRHELGLGDLPGLAAFRAALDLLDAVGMPAIEAQIARLTARCVEGLQARGIALLTPTDPARRAGVLAIRTPSSVDLADFLRARRVDVWGYTDGRLRIDPHGFNDDNDLERLFQGIDDYSRERGGLGTPAGSMG